MRKARLIVLAAAPGVEVDFLACIKPVGITALILSRNQRRAPYPRDVIQAWLACAVPRVCQVGPVVRPALQLVGAMRAAPTNWPLISSRSAATTLSTPHAR